eukprot:TRINITY_DN19652_c0_g1_i1.p1 TRINITY_DN19652_c0_g1~~TRINITY_DN19652_c0_g1_i1.p1  ORF type:complete len:442 (+),score=103.07 TRINITY_DN19652_c0_g1_i1:119-1444(+)
MGSVRSWIGSILSFAVFLVVRRFTAGLALPSFIAIVVAILYAWTVVLRVPQFKTTCDAEPHFEAATDSNFAGQGLAKTMAATPAVSAAEPIAKPTSESVLKPPAGVISGSDADSAVKEDSGVCVAPSSPKELPIPEHARQEVDIRRDTDSVATVGEVPVTSSVAAATDTGVGEAAASPEFVASSSKDVTLQETDPCSPADVSTQCDEDEEKAPVSAGMPSCAADEAPKAADDVSAAAEVPAGEDRDDGSSTDEEERIRREEADYVDPERAKELRVLGNDFFKSGKVHDAREAYSEALHLTPSADKKDRAVLFCNRAACQQKLGRWEDTISDCTQAVQLDPEYVKAYSRRSTAYEQQSKWSDANEDLKKAIELDPSLRSKEYKRQAVLEARAQEQFEKDKTEMIGKLKELGNTVLGKFGMSCDNFKMEQDPNTGSYSLKYGS